MNVLFIVDNSLSNPVLFSQGYPHIQENSKKGVKYSILSFEDNDFLRRNPAANNRYDEALTELHNYAQLFTTKINMSLRFSTLRLLIKGVIIGAKIVKKNKINIIHGRGNLSSLVAIFIKRLFDVKVLYDNRGLFSDEIDKKNRLRIVIELWIEKYLLKKSDNIVVVSNVFKSYLSDKYSEFNLNKKIIVVENSFSEKRFVYSEQLRVQQRDKHKLNDRFIMVYSGPSVYWQRFDLILKTFKILKELKENAYLLIVSYDADIERITINAGINKKDFSVYNLSASEVNKYLIMGDFGVIYRDDRMRSKVCAPIKLGEYLASGLPILSMNEIGDTEIVLNKYGTGIIVNNEMKIKVKLLEMIDLVKKPGIKIKCRITAEENLSLQRSADKYFSIYRSMQ